MASSINIGTEQACVALIDNIKNGDVIKKQLIEGNFSAALVSCTNILDLRQLQIASFKASTNSSRDKMATHNIYSEIIFQLFPNRQISQAFKTFGMQITDTACVAVTVGDSREADMQHVLDVTAADGAICLPFDEIHRFHSLPSIKKTYKIQETELSVGTLSEAVVSRIAAKEIMS